MCELVKEEMSDTLESKTIRLHSGNFSNTGRRIWEHWWTDLLSDLWNNVCDTVRANGRMRQTLKVKMRVAQKRSDKEVHS